MRPRTSPHAETHERETRLIKWMIGNRARLSAALLNAAGASFVVAILQA